MVTFKGRALVELPSIEELDVYIELTKQRGELVEDLMTTLILIRHAQRIVIHYPKLTSW